MYHSICETIINFQEFEYLCKCETTKFSVTVICTCTTMSIQVYQVSLFSPQVDDGLVVDATMAGGPARYINHSCNPNCLAEVVQFERDSKIIIIAKRRIVRGEEVGV